MRLGGLATHHGRNRAGAAPATAADPLADLLLGVEAADADVSAAVSAGGGGAVGERACTDGTPLGQG